MRSAVTVSALVGLVALLVAGLYGYVRRDAGSDTLDALVVAAVVVLVAVLIGAVIALEGRRRHDNERGQ